MLDGVTPFPPEVENLILAHPAVPDVACVPCPDPVVGERMCAWGRSTRSRVRLLTIGAAHPGWPWTDEMTAVALHKGNVYRELSGWAPKCFPRSLRTGIRGRLREKMMSGSDHPSLPYERILRERDEPGYHQPVTDLVFHANAERVLGL